MQLTAFLKSSAAPGSAGGFSALPSPNLSSVRSISIYGNPRQSRGLSAVTSAASISALSCISFGAGGYQRIVAATLNNVFRPNELLTDERPQHVAAEAKRSLAAFERAVKYGCFV